MDGFHSLENGKLLNDVADIITLQYLQKTYTRRAEGKEATKVHGRYKLESLCRAVQVNFARNAIRQSDN